MSVYQSKIELDVKNVFRKIAYHSAQKKKQNACEGFAWERNFHFQF